MTGVADSKAQVQGAETELAKLDDWIRRLKADLARVEHELPEKRTARTRLQGELDGFRIQKSEAFKERHQRKKRVDNLESELAKFNKELEEYGQERRAEGQVRQSAQVATTRIEKTLRELTRVKEEIAALESEPAKKAFLEAAGADLPEEIVPTAVHPLPFEDSSADAYAKELSVDSLWKETDSGALAPSGSESHLRSALRVSLQSEAVLAALQRSLCVRAAELRESLRQWGFAESAAARTKELSDDFKLSIRTAAAECEELHADRLQKIQQREADSAALGKLKASQESLERRHVSLLAELECEKAHLRECRVRKELMISAIDERSRQFDQLSFEHAEASETLNTSKAALERHPAEATWRCGSAEKLALQAEAQAKRSALQLEQTRQEFVSFKNAHAVLTDAHIALGNELENQRQAHAELRDEHDKIHQDLNALARHYMGLLPPLPGMDVPPELPGAALVQVGETSS